MAKKSPLPTLDDDPQETSHPKGPDEVPTQPVVVEVLDPSADVPSFVYAAVPEDREQAMKLACEGVLDAFRHSCLRYWNVGRIMSTLEGRGEKNLVQDLMTMTRLEERTVRYMLAFFRRFQNIEKVIQLSSKGVGWSQFKQLAALSKDADRDRLVADVLNDKIEVDKLDAAVDKIKEKVKTDKTKDGPKKCSATKFFSKLLKEMQNLAGHNFEIKAEIVSYSELLNEEERVSEEECQQCVSMAREAIKTIDSVQSSLKDIAEKMQTEVVNALGSPVKPVRSAAIPAKGNSPAKPAAGK